MIIIAHLLLTVPIDNCSSLTGTGTGTYIFYNYTTVSCLSQSV